MTTNEAVFTKDTQNKKLTVVRTFNAELARVWKAWTDSAILDQWWAPKPYRAVTKSMDFREGGHWQYAMTGPEDDKQWCREEFKTIDEGKRFTFENGFCDENGVRTHEMPIMDMEIIFDESNGATTVTTVISFEKPEDMEAILKMGFEQGFAMGLGNLEEYLANH
ncbi:SRPBCC domain-containing protein [Flavobacterium sp. LaA7.5]|nr:SRPBCC domain-containing protein [Flavobacterium salilacus subsp. altitudinum]